MHTPPPFFSLLAIPQMHPWLLTVLYPALSLPPVCVPCALLLGLAAQQNVPGQLISAVPSVRWVKYRGFRVTSVFTAIRLVRKLYKK